MKKIIIIQFFSFCLSIALFSNTYFISPKGYDNQSGTLENPWHDIEKASKKLQPGDTLFIRGGTYRIDQAVRLKISGEENNPIVITAFPEETPIINAIDFLKERKNGDYPSKEGIGAIHIEGSSYLIVNGLSVLNSRNIGIQVKKSQNIEVKNCYTDRTYGSGIALWYADNCSVHHCEIIKANDQSIAVPGQPLGNEAPHEALTIAGATNFLVYKNHVHHCFKEGIDCKEVSAHGKIFDNRMHDLPRQGLYVDCWFGLLEDVEFYNNTVYDCEWGMAISAEGKKSSMKNIRIHHNTLYNNRASGILFGVWGNDEIREDIQIYNNTIYNNGSPNHWAGVVGGIDIRSSHLKDVNIYNNICYKNWGFEIATFAKPDVVGQQLKKKNINIKNNLSGKFLSKEQTKGFFEPVYGYLGQHSVLGDPHFVDETNNDFRIMPDSPAMGKGKPLYKDYSPRTDIGAHPVILYNEIKTGIPRIPVLVGEPWKICETPDLQELNGPDPHRQHIVDHGFVQDNVGNWHLWACLRGTDVGRLLYKWEGKSLEKGLWEPKGIAARAEEEWGEQINDKGEESIQAPYFLNLDNKYYCFYNSNGARLMISENGKDYERYKIKDDNNIMFKNAGRDVMILKDGNTYFCYSTLSLGIAQGWAQGYVVVRTSTNLKNWGDYTMVAGGGIAGNGPVSSESPFVVKMDDFYYLFRASSMTFKTYVYRSRNPFSFGVNDDSKLIATLPIKAPEIIHHNNKWYISDLADFNGIRIQELQWDREE